MEYPPIIYIYIYQATPKYTGHSIPMFLVGAFPKRFLDLKARVEIKKKKKWYEFWGGGQMASLSIVHLPLFPGLCVTED